MKRRDFLKTTGTLAAAAALPGVTGFAATPEATGRTILPINRGWRFHPAKVTGSESPSFDDSHFERVILPHTNVTMPWHSFDDKDYEFISTYRRRFKYPEAARGRRVFVDFEGAMTASTVWINGHPLGEYKGGFTPFSFELTKYLDTTGGNVLTVQLDSTERSDMPPFGNEIDYMTFGGIYREVSLRIVPEIYLDNIFARPQNVLTSGPTVEVDCFLAGNSTQRSALTLEAELRDGDRVLARASKTIQPASAADPNAAMDPATDAPVYASTQTKDDPAHKSRAAQYGSLQSTLGSARRSLNCSSQPSRTNRSKRSTALNGARGSSTGAPPLFHALQSK